MSVNRFKSGSSAESSCRLVSEICPAFLPNEQNVHPQRQLADGHLFEDSKCGSQREAQHPYQ